MSLENLLKIGQLKEHPADVQEIERLLAAAALQMHGYRPDPHRPGHHATVLQSTPLTLGLSPKRVVVLDALRRQRNVSDYTGDDVDESIAENCIIEARRLIDEVIAWRAARRPELVPKKKS